MRYATKVLLISDEYYLLSMQGGKECFVFFYHRGLVDNDAFKASTSDLLCKGTCNCSNNAWERFKDDLFKLVFILHKDLELTET